jgi:AcrR family transcriptional regulator
MRAIRPNQSDSVYGIQMVADTIIEPGRRLRRDAELNRTKILQAAREVFARQGLDATLHHIAQHAGLGVGTVYRHFRNRDHILDDLFAESIEELRRVGRDALACEDPWQGLVQFIERSVQMMMTDRGLWTLAIGGASKSQNLAKGRENFWHVVPQLLRRAQASGQLRADFRPEDMCVISMMMGTSAQFTSHQSPEAWRRYLTFLLDGLRGDRALSPLPVPELTESQLDRAMDAWYPERRGTSMKHSTASTSPAT